MSEMHDKSMEDMINIVNGGTVDDPKVAAAIKELIDRQDFPGIEAALDKFGNQHGLASRTLGHDLGSTDLFTGGQLGAISQGHAGGTYADIVNNNIKDGIFSPEKISTAGPALLNEASRLATSQEARNSLMSSATTALNDPILSTKISRNRNALTAFQSGHASHDISNGENIW
jgi:hypothetical protein